MKKIFLLFTLLFAVFTLNAQSDDDLFGSSFEEDLFGSSDDDLFGDDGIEELEDVSAQSDLSKGILFENGSVKIGGTFTSEISTQTSIYNDSDDSFADNLKNTKINPNVGALLSVDARPNQDLRMYSKFGFRYPFASQYIAPNIVNNQPSIQDWIYLKEMFTDFSLADRAFFRFGLHTVTWGTGYFFSPVSDIINTSSINPEDVEAQVDGCLNLRTQITFPGSQNCLWLYVLPSFDYAKDTALAGKFDLVLGGWELGFGGYYKYNASPKVTLTATGSIKKFNIFGEAVYQYGSDKEWALESDKSNIFRATAGFSYMWKDPSILLAAQYYYDGSNFTLESQEDYLYFLSNPLYIKENLTQGHNIAAMVNFGRIFGTTDVTATIFGMVNFGKEDLPESAKISLSSYGAESLINAATISGMIYYAPTNTLKMGIGPYITFTDLEETPDVALKLSLTLGGGKF